ncbi:MAG TPA: polymer-forming cytoskeletal protein [Gammaproteobacteria bacterium]
MALFRRRIADSSRGPTTFIAPSTKIVGTITGGGPYVFCGTVEGDCDIDGPVTLAAGGRWKGTMRATDVIVSGEVDGDVVARQRVEISGTARVTGSLSGHSIAVAEGAVIEGEIKVMSGAEPLAFEEKRRTETREPTADSAELEPASTER